MANSKATKIMICLGLILYLTGCAESGGESSNRATINTIDDGARVTLQSNLSTIDYDGVITLSWATNEVLDCVASGDWSGSKDTAGSEVISSLVVDSTFELTCTEIDGEADAEGLVPVASKGRKVKDTVAITVRGPKPPTISLSASPTTVAMNGSTTINWSSKHASGCTASGDWSGSKTTSGSQAINALIANATFNLSCSGTGGSANDSVSVTVVAPSAPIVNLSASPSNLPYNGSTTLSWSSSNTSGCTASGDWTGNMATSGSQSMSALTTNSSFNLFCSGPGGSANDSISVTVASPTAPSVNLSASPSTLPYNGSTTLSWSSNNVTGCLASGDWSGNMPTSGSQTINALTANSTFSIFCDGVGGTANDTLSVLVTPPASNGSTVSQYGITWTFDNTYEIGQFVNGDYYVIDDGSGVTITSITPVPGNGRNGSMVNPIRSAGQGFDSRGLDYEPSFAQTLPMTLYAGDSLLSSVSLDGSESSNWAGGNIGSNQKLRTVAVLTVLSAIPPAGSFRPSYVDRNHTLYNVNQINTSILPSLPPISGYPSNSGFGALEYYVRGMDRPWILFGNDWQSRAIHPAENMLDYHEKIGEFLSEASVLLMTDIPNKDELLHRFVQVGIDYYYNRTSDSSAWAWPIVFAGLMLDEPSIYNFWVNNPNIRTERGHEKLYYIGDVVESTNSTIIPEGKTWVDWVTPGGKYVAFRKQKGEEYEHLHPSEWACYEPHCKAEVYRAQHDVYPLVGMVLSSVLVDNMTSIDVNSKLAHDPMRDYIDRWMSNIFQTGQYQNTGRTYRQEMEANTSFTIYNYNYGSGGSSFVNEMWQVYR